MVIPSDSTAKTLFTNVAGKISHLVVNLLLVSVESLVAPEAFAARVAGVGTFVVVYSHVIQQRGARAKKFTALGTQFTFLFFCTRIDFFLAFGGFFWFLRFFHAVIG